MKKKIKKVQTNPQVFDLERFLLARNVRLLFTTVVLLSISLDGFILNSHASPQGYNYYLYRATLFYLGAYLFGISPLLSETIVRLLDDRDNTNSAHSKILRYLPLLIIGYFIFKTYEFILFINSKIRIIFDKSMLPFVIGITFFFVIYFIKFKKAREMFRDEALKEEILEKIAITKAISAAICYFVSLGLFRVSLMYSALAISAGGYNLLLYGLLLIIILATCVLLKTLYPFAIPQLKVETL